MTNYGLPTSAEIGGMTYAIRSDYRAVLDVIEVMNDTTISDEDRTLISLTIFYDGFESMPLTDFQAAIDYMKWFINGGNDNNKRKKGNPRLMNWQQDFKLIVSPINHILNCEVRALDYLHWWTFLSAYMEIGDCTFAQVVSIRKKRMQGKKLDKQDQQFYNENVDLIEIQVQETDEEKALFEQWMNLGGE